nr:WG repeat-containing protein [Clostridia bacterium]
MKKLTMLLCLTMALVSLCALAADADTETALWPAYDPVTGLWGYIREDGAWGIEPRYTEAYHFHDGCAIVDMAEHAHADTPTQGIIDETGAFLLDAEYYVFDFWDAEWDCGPICFVMDDDGGMGWFNIPNRFFSGIHWRECIAWRDTPYVVVDSFDADSGLALRESGEIVVPTEYAMTGIYDDVEDGFLVTDRADGEGCELIEIGVGVVELPEGIYVDYVVGVADGMVPYCTEDGTQGYLNTAGEIVIEAQYDAGGEFWDGYADVVLMDGTDAIIDRSGNVVFTGHVNYYGMVAGALFVEWTDGTWGLVETDGTIRCRHALPEGAYSVWLYEFTEDGPLWVKYSLGDYEYLWALMSRDGELLGEPQWSWVSHREGEAWLAVCEDERYGYTDACGNTVLPFEWMEAEAFDGALARVAINECTEAYINREGKVIRQWTFVDDGGQIIE